MLTRTIDLACEGELGCGAAPGEPCRVMMFTGRPLIGSYHQARAIAAARLTREANRAERERR